MTVEKNENGNLGDFGHRSCQNLENVNIDQFLSKPHSKYFAYFLLVFVDFDRENINVHDFLQNISNRARSSAFFMYIDFLLQIKSSWRNIGFSVENTVENVRRMLNLNTKHLYDYVFGNNFDSKSNIST